MQLVGETRRPLPLRPGHPACYDDEYKREGTAHLFLFVQLWRGWLKVNVTARRTKRDFAPQMHLSVDVHFPEAELVRWWLINSIPILRRLCYETWPPAEARRITCKLEFHYTPKHGRWLKMAECEFAVLSAQCLDRQIPDVATLWQEIDAWQAKRNQYHTKINWRFSTHEARVKLKRLYPLLD